MTEINRSKKDFDRLLRPVLSVKINFDRKFDRLFSVKIYFDRHLDRVMSVKINFDRNLTELSVKNFSDRTIRSKYRSKFHLLTDFSVKKSVRKKPSNPIFTRITFSSWTIKLLTMRPLHFLLLWNEKCNNWCFGQLQNYTSKQ